MILNSLRLGVWLCIITGCLIACSEVKDPALQKESRFIVLEGETMGTYYRVTYDHPQNLDLKQAVDSVLIEVNKGVNTYDPTSLISTFNQSGTGIDLDIDQVPAQHLVRNWQIAQEVYNKTDGDFDPTVMPLVNYWGFGYDGRKAVTQVDSQAVDSLSKFVGFDKVIFEDLALKKATTGVQLDFSACAKGYGVDQVGLLLEAMNCTDYLVDIGGEVRARGVNKKGDAWKIGINTPKEDAPLDKFEVIIGLSNLSLATSGNYRNFYEVDGVKYGHTINPKTGFPERNRLLSASVFAPNCLLADAYATAFMVMGLDKALALAESEPEIEAYLIYGGEDGQLKVKYTTNVASFLVD